ncbi:MAG: hypothetical protein VW647_06985 [Alphaproteobacteria bacterium]
MTSQKTRIPIYLLGLSLTMASLASCAKNELVACPSITAPVEATEAFGKTDNLGHLIDVRFNGVNAICTRKGNGDTHVAVAAGLKVKRDLTEGSDADVAVIGMAAAIVGPDDEVVSTEAFGYRIGFRKGLATDYPVAEIEFDLAPDQRLVLMLTPTR